MQSTGQQHARHRHVNIHVYCLYQFIKYVMCTVPYFFPSTVQKSKYSWRAALSAIKCEKFQEKNLVDEVIKTERERKNVEKVLPFFDYLIKRNSFEFMFRFVPKLLSKITFLFELLLLLFLQNIYIYWADIFARCVITNNTYLYTKESASFLLIFFSCTAYFINTVILYMFFFFLDSINGICSFF